MKSSRDPDSFVEQLKLCSTKFVKSNPTLLQDEEGEDEEEEESDYRPSEGSDAADGSEDYDSDEDYSSEGEDEEESGE